MTVMCFSNASRKDKLLKNVMGDNMIIRDTCKNIIKQLFSQIKKSTKFEKSKMRALDIYWISTRNFAFNNQKKKIITDSQISA